MKLLIVSVLFCFHSVLAINENETTLVAVQVVFNHGVRSPLTSYPDNPNNIWSKYSSSTGQLTDVGMRQMYEFGQFLRQKYPSLNTVYDRTRAWAYASGNLKITA